ncbi:WD repeat- and FYVE domain-containing protein 4 [Lampris incognitus]|uniref:WD repeat- and FYVE domain-containing protein 4 n=1 Tax=Lampris incognitus TaxID=2546036 RepID=UPI0024B60793|nr:WD repeat- and FYVE domain-containing protein 4 [Lampris incognitus]
MALTPPQEWMGGLERINKETGELSASGELAVSVKIKEEDGDVTAAPQTLQELKDQVKELGSYPCPDPDTIHHHIPVEQREEHLLRVLPLYIQAYETSSGIEGLDLRGLASQTAESLVSSIHSRLSKRPRQEARYQVVQCFQKPDGKTGSAGKDNPGWLLLKSLSFLLTDNPDILSWISPGLPAALVKCLYLLVCLPTRKDSASNEETFHELLTQVLLPFCRHPASAEKMVESQELQCLIIGLTSLWDQTSACWRHQASRVLRTISAVQTPNTVLCLTGKDCIRICIQNLLRISADVPGPMLAEVAVAVFSFIRDTYHLDPALFVQFDTNNGYMALESILKRCEKGVSADHVQPVEDLLALVASLTLFGKAELKVALCVNNPQPPGFKFDPPLTKGLAVKNLPAFHVLQSSFLRSEDPLLCRQILRTLRTIWEWDPANFFLLEWTIQSFAQLASNVWRKPAPVHKPFFSMLETVVFKFNYVPHETLRAVQGVLKQSWAGTLTAGVAGVEFGVAALDCFHRISVFSGLLAEVLSDGGLLELLLGELRRRAKILRKAGVASAHQTSPQEQSPVVDHERVLTTCMLKVVSALTLRSIRNTVSVRDLGMVPYIKIFLDEEQYRGPTLSILEQLAEINPEEFMSTAVGALCSSTLQEVGLKQDLLQSVLRVLESPNSWDAFRRAGGFTGLLSMVVDMEGALSDSPQGSGWKTVGRQEVLDLLLLNLHILALAVHLHPVNAHHFQMGGFYERLAEALLQLGCFQKEVPDLANEDWSQGYHPRTAEDKLSHGRSFHQFVEMAGAPEMAGVTSSSGIPCLEPNLPFTLQACIRLLSYLDQFATGTYAAVEPNLGVEAETESGGEREALNGEAGMQGDYTGSPRVHFASDSQCQDDPQGRSRNTAFSISSVCSESQSRFICDHTILHPGAIRVIMTLLPSVFTPEDPQLSLEIQFSVAHHVQAMVKSERNRQIMCEGGLVSTLLTRWRNTLLAPDHPLHLPVTRILEKLSSQAITLSDFRKFLCLGDPLMCLTDKMTRSSARQDAGAEADGSTGGSEKRLKKSFSLLSSCESAVGSPLPVHQMISLISMTSPRSFRPHRVSSSPAFVEFDMSESGYGCLYLPSMATVKGVNADSISTGGVGGDCRGFPPVAGLSYSCWFQINRFSSACDSHPIRLLSVIRHMSRAEQLYICLSVSFSAYDGCLVISTEEEAYTFLDMMEPEVSTPSSMPTSLRFRCSSMLVPGQWLHLAVVMAKDVKKSCRVSAYLNGKTVGTAKMRYIQPFPGQYASMDPTALIDVCALIGTPPLWKEHAALVWRVGPTYLFEEVLSPEMVATIYTQGTSYLGNYMALRSTGLETDAEHPSLRLVPEERISFGINPAVATVTTVAQIREDYNEVDCRLIAKELGIPSRDQSTPVFLARNISQHLSGTARTIGAALVGHFGVRTFTPRSAANGFLYVGGPTVILSLVAMAPDDSSLYAAVKVLLSVLETSPTMQQELIRINGYKLLAFLLKIKKSLISSRTFQLVLYLSSSLDLGSGPACLHNTAAFQALLCNLEVWHNTSENLELSLLNHFDEILTSSRGGNAEVLHTVGLLPKLLFQLSDPDVTIAKVKVTSCIIQSLLEGHFTTVDLSRLGLFLVYTLSAPSNLIESCWISDGGLPEDTTAQKSCEASPIWIRNQLLLSLCELLNSDSLTTEQQKAFFDTLGSDWFLLFLQPHLHPSTIRLGLVLLTHLLSNHNQQSNFREGVLPGTLVEDMEELFTVMDNLRAHSWSYECLSTTCPGFDILQVLLVGQCHLPQVYGALAALLLGKKAGHAAEPQVHLDDVLQSAIDGRASASVGQLCPEPAAILLELVKAIITQPASKRQSGGDAWKLRFPGSVMQFLCLLHSLWPRDPLWASAGFLHVLAGAVYPLDGSEDAAEDEAAARIHPTRKQVCDFIRILLMDSLLNVPAGSSHPLLLLLEFSPESASLEQRQSFQTEFLEFLMDIIHVISHQEENDTHLSSHGAKSQKPHGQTATLMENVVLFSKTLLHKLYSGMYSGDPEHLLTFLADQIVVALERGQAQREKTVSALYSCTNKVLLYFLSHSRHSPKEQEVVIKTLQVFMERWDVVMATYNSNVTFVTCLLHCLLLIRSNSYPEGFGCEVQKRHSQRLFDRLLPFKSSRPASSTHTTDSATGQSELASLVEACWSRVMAERRHSLEDTYKLELSAGQRVQTGGVSMSDISPLWQEIAQNTWQTFTDRDKKAGLISSAVRSVLGRPGRESATVQEFLSCMESHRQRAHSVFETMKMNHAQLCASEWERVSSQWLRAEEELLRERGVFGPGPGVMPTWGWVQDAAEGPNRTRPRIRRRAQRRSKRVQTKTKPRILCEAGTEAKEEEEEAKENCDRLTFFPVLNETMAMADTPREPCTPEPCCQSQSCPDIHLILQELHPGEEVKVKRCIVVVSGLRVTEGVLLFGKETLYICEGFTLSTGGDVCCRKHHPSSVRDSSISTMLDEELSPASCKRWPYEDIREARFMRFLLEDNALEIFMRNGHSAFLVFLNRDHVSAYKRLCSMVPSLKGRGVAEVIANARQTPVVGKTALLKWQRGEMSNFEYLMHLNTLAGRTYNDLMQYPVFPWVLADYESETLDLSNPATFRDLSKPMGAQTEKRREMFIQRYEDVENSERDGDLSVQCHYYTHYSSAIIIASFLVRMEPFSHAFLALQVRPLVTGCMEDGTALGDVVLPPWAKDDPQEFIRVHREALESDYVSSHLHLWIDLIFGHRQQGPAAVESINTFHPYFYAQRRGQEALADPLIKSTILGYVSNFGQVPKQLFTKPHSPRNASKKEGSSPPQPTPFFFRLDKLKTSAQPFKELPRGPVGQIACLEKEVLVLERNRLLLSPQRSCVFSWGFPDNSCAFGNCATEKTFAVCESLCDWGETLCATCPNQTTVVTAGTSTAVCVWDVAVGKDKLTHMKLKKPLYGHTGAVACLAVSEVHGVMVSGSLDLTCILWDLEELSFIAQLAGHRAAITALAINDLTGEIASCAGALLYLWTMKGQLLTHVNTSCGPQGDILCVSFTQRQEWDPRNAIVTGCADGVVRIWKTEYTRTQLPDPPEEPASPGQSRSAARTDGDASGGAGGAKGWERHLVLCRELSRGQAASKRPNKTNPAITALAMSRSNATLLAGDAWGRVFTWVCE